MAACPGWAAMARATSVRLYKHGRRFACKKELVDTLLATLDKIRKSKSSWTVEEWAIATDSHGGNGRPSLEWSDFGRAGRRHTTKLEKVMGAKTATKAKASAAKTTAKASVDEVVQVRSPALPIGDKENTGTVMTGDQALVSVVDDKVHHWPPAEVTVEDAVGVGVHSFAVLHFIAKGRSRGSIHHTTRTLPPVTTMTVMVTHPTYTKSHCATPFRRWCGVYFCGPHKGAYGRVYKAVHNATGTHVAIKVVEVDGHLASEQARELAMLKTLRGHPNIVRLYHATLRMFTYEIVLEYCDKTLHDLIKQRRSALASGMCVTFTRQLFEGLRFVHSNRIVHRDIKPTNLLVAGVCAAASPLAQPCLKIADFGLARAIPAVGDDDRSGIHMSGGVFTRYYRPFEVLLGSRTYGTAADVWAAGCSCGEMCHGEPIFPGSSSSEMIALICKEVGTPSVSTWPDLEEMPRFNKELKNAKKVEGNFVAIGRCGLIIGDKYGGLMRATLEPVPSARWTAYEACSADLE